ncbi:unnamed protein product [Meloidogyne enterolobii]|uniref:Uncharacterized protein n=1 Tax=Meloidogyne enterolobii TaxID=390850 RepID=A0ACB0YJT0_MELEN
MLVVLVRHYTRRLFFYFLESVAVVVCVFIFIYFFLFIYVNIFIFLFIFYKPRLSKNAFSLLRNQKKIFLFV